MISPTYPEVVEQLHSGFLKFSSLHEGQPSLLILIKMETKIKAGILLHAFLC